MRYGWIAGLAVASGPAWADVPGGLFFCRDMAAHLSVVARAYGAILDHEEAFALSVQQAADNAPDDHALRSMGLSALRNQADLTEVMRPSGESILAAVDLLKSACPGD